MVKRAAGTAAAKEFVLFMEGDSRSWTLKGVQRWHARRGRLNTQAIATSATKKELVARAAELGVTGRSRMNKAELAVAISLAENHRPQR
jgi:hypothetical protein